MQQQQIKQAGLKATGPRIRILRILERCRPRHLSVEDVYKELAAGDEALGLATIYRVLTRFESAGLVCRQHFERGQAVFELNRGAHHDHLVCRRCGKVEEFRDEIIERRQTEIAAVNRFSPTNHAFVIYGTCPDCVKNALVSCK